MKSNEKFTQRAESAIENALAEAAALGHSCVGSEHLLLGILAERDSAAARLLLRGGIEPEELRRATAASLGRGFPGAPSQGLSADARRVVEAAGREARQLRHSFIGTEHMLLAILHCDACGAKKLLDDRGLDADALWPGNVCCALVFNGGFLRANHDLARAVTQGYAAAGEELTAHPEERAPLAKQHLKATGKVLALSLQWIAYDDLAITPAAYDDLVQRMQAIHLIEEAPAYDAFVDATLLAPSQPSSMTTSPTDSTERK